MEIIKFETEYVPDDTVYHILEDSPRGIVLDVIYNMRSKLVSYSIAWSNDTTSVCLGVELSASKVF